MTLLDSNIVTDATQPQWAEVLSFLDQGRFSYSAVTRIEVLGYHRLTAAGADSIGTLLQTMTELAVTGPVIERATQLRRQHNLKLGDAVIAATTLVHELPLATHNTRDFARIPGLALLDPLENTNP